MTSEPEAEAAAEPRTRCFLTIHRGRKLPEREDGGGLWGKAESEKHSEKKAFCVFFNREQAFSEPEWCPDFTGFFLIFKF